MNKLGTHIQIWTAGWSVEEIEFAAKNAKKIGYDFLEIPVRAPETVDVDGIKSVLDKYGLQCATSFVHSLETDIASEDKQVVQKGIDLMKKALDCAKSLETIAFVGGMTSALNKYNEIRSEQGRNNAIAALAEVADYADTLGLNLNLEALNRYENNLVNSCAQAKAMCQAINRPNIRIQLDSFHMNIEEADPAQALLSANDLLGYYHVAENNRGYLGSGSIDFTAQFRSLAQINYQGPIALEVFSSVVSNPSHSGRLAVWRDVWKDSVDIASHAFDYIHSQINTAQRYKAFMKEEQYL